MEKELNKLKKNFKPYYIVYLSQLPKKGFKKVKCYNFKTVVKYQLTREYINSEWVSFEQYLLKYIKKRK